MQKDIFENSLKRKISQITFSGHRVNDGYSLNKRKEIIAVVLSAFDEAAEQCVETDEGDEYDFTDPDQNPYLLSGQELERTIALRSSR